MLRVEIPKYTAAGVHSSLRLFGKAIIIYAPKKDNTLSYYLLGHAKLSNRVKTKPGKWYSLSFLIL